MHSLCAFAVLDEQLVGELNFALALTGNVKHGQFHFAAFTAG
jgi:hypothetical protein